ncbi:hypothetical protein pb186bvf_016644 [Paramecium bursaria]
MMVCLPHILDHYLIRAPCSIPKIQPCSQLPLIVMTLSQSGTSAIRRVSSLQDGETDKAHLWYCRFGFNTTSPFGNWCQLKIILLQRNIKNNLYIIPNPIKYESQKRNKSHNYLQSKREMRIFIQQNI